ncbi:hypothetical protein NU09_3442 [Flavobacterium beibuense]|uniref:Uncharacterized protein n=1 Tax=Flavobacterium beibuense TaxID=657326 RepID=A0A444W3D1_9FLAO|nr:hypothetical protein NU09_3442 [Flavobacterium beibuense]
MDVANDAITAAKINADVAGTGLIQNTTTGALEVDVTGLSGDGNITSTDLDVTGGTDAAFADVTINIKDGAVTTAKLADDAVTNAKLADDAVATVNLIDDSVTADKINGDIAGAGLTQNATTGALEVDVTALSGDGDITSSHLNVTGGTDAAFNDVTLSINDDVINSDMIIDGTIATEDIENGAVTTAKMNAGTGANGRIAMADASGNVSFNSVSTYNISNGDSSISVSGGNNAALANTSISVNNGGISTAKLADDSVTAAKINSDVAGNGITQNATTGALEVDLTGLSGDGNITSTDIDVTGGTGAAFNDVTLTIADGAVTTDKIADGTITEADIASGGNNKTLTTDESGNVGWTNSPVIPNSMMPKFFYMPAVIFDTSVYTGTPVTGITRDLYQEYVNQFEGASNPLMIKSDVGGADEAPDDIPYLPTAESLYYYITYYDTAVFANLSIDANGVLSYDVIGSGTQTSYMNIVFVIK